MLNFRIRGIDIDCNPASRKKMKTQESLLHATLFSPGINTFFHESLLGSEILRLLRIDKQMDKDAMSSLTHFELSVRRRTTIEGFLNLERSFRNLTSLSLRELGVKEASELNYRNRTNLVIGPRFTTLKKLTLEYFRSYDANLVMDSNILLCKIELRSSFFDSVHVDISFLKDLLVRNSLDRQCRWVGILENAVFATVLPPLETLVADCYNGLLAAKLCHRLPNLKSLTAQEFFDETKDHHRTRDLTISNEKLEHLDIRFDLHAPTTKRSLLALRQWTNLQFLKVAVDDLVFEMSSSDKTSSVIFPNLTSLELETNLQTFFSFLEQIDIYSFPQLSRLNLVIRHDKSPASPLDLNLSKFRSLERFHVGCSLGVILRGGSQISYVSVRSPTIRVVDFNQLEELHIAGEVRSLELLGPHSLRKLSLGALILIGSLPRYPTVSKKGSILPGNHSLQLQPEQIRDLWLPIHATHPSNSGTTIFDANNVKAMLERCLKLRTLVLDFSDYKVGQQVLGDYITSCCALSCLENLWISDYRLHNNQAIIFERLPNIRIIGLTGFRGCRLLTVQCLPLLETFYFDGKILYDNVSPQFRFEQLPYILGISIHGTVVDTLANQLLNVSSDDSNDSNLEEVPSLQLSVRIHGCPRLLHFDSSCSFSLDSDSPPIFSYANIQ